jgi:hypothetical protein
MTYGDRKASITKTGKSGKEDTRGWIDGQWTVPVPVANVRAS